jgi:hypothetical protein
VLRHYRIAYHPAGRVSVVKLPTAHWSALRLWVFESSGGPQRQGRGASLRVKADRAADPEKPRHSIRPVQPMSALGQKQTLEPASGMSALPPKADITLSCRAGSSHHPHRKIPGSSFMPDDVSRRAWRRNFSARPIHVGFKGNRRPWVRITPFLRKV